ncbi:MAG: flagellar hook-basal body complex protein FliE [Verrucomicrobiia bacterium]|jgi:flagellar hook-basal body complex protein FliE
MTGFNSINPVQSNYIYPGIKNLQGLGVDKVGGNIPAEEINKLIQFESQNVKSNSVGSFENLLTNFVNQVNEKQNVADATVKGLLSGQEVSLHQAVIAMEEANLSFSLMVEVRNKLVEAYQELMRMQI